MSFLGFYEVEEHQGAKNNVKNSPKCICRTKNRFLSKISGKSLFYPKVGKPKEVKKGKRGDPIDDLPEVGFLGFLVWKYEREV